MKTPELSTDFAINFREYLMKEPLPLATIHAQVLQFLCGRIDAAIFGAQAVNTYVETPRMTQDVDVLSTNGKQLAEELRDHLHNHFNVAVRVREVAKGLGHRIYQVRTPKNRHLVDIRQVAKLPACQTVGDLQVVDPVQLIAMKLISMTARPHTPKGLTDQADTLRMLLAFPDLKTLEGPVQNALAAADATPEALATWSAFVAQDIKPEDDDTY